MQRLPLTAALLAGLLPALLLTSCDESESTLGGVPGGQAIVFQDSVAVLAVHDFHVSQSMVGAARHAVGRSDSLGLESVLLLRLDYDPFEDWPDLPEGTPSVHFSFKMDNSEAMAWFPQRQTTPPETGESANYLDLDLFLLADSAGYEDAGWEDFFDDTTLAKSVLDRVSFRVSSADTAFGDDEDPLTGRRTYRSVPAWWFQHADTTARWMMVRARPGQQGFVPLLAAGYTSLLRPGFRFSSMQIDTVYTGNVAIPDTSFDTTFVAASWQTSFIHDVEAAGRPTISSGWAGQVYTLLPAFPPDPEQSLYDPLTSTLAEAWLRIPLEEAAFNRAGAKVNLYAVASGDSGGVDVESEQLIATKYATDSTTTLSFNITSYLRRVWVEDDTLSNSEPIALVLKIDDYYLLQPRKLRLADPLFDRPRLVYALSQAPEGWVQP